MQKKNNLILADRSLQALHDQHHIFLFDDYLPFIDKFVFDHEYGGFMCHTDRKGNNLTKNKRTWYDGRGIWVYSFLYNHIKKDVTYFNIAQKTVDLVLKAKDSNERFWPWSYDREGNNLEEHFPDIYGNLFVAEGLAEFSIASGEQRYWEKSKDILLQCVSIYDRDDYAYLLEYSPIGSFSHAERVLGHWMIMLRLGTNLLKTRADKKVESVVDRCIKALIESHYNPQNGLMNEVLSHDLSRPKGEIGQFVYIGHAIESLWMLMDEALRREDQQLFDIAAARFKFHVEVAWDDVYGGVFHCLDHVDQNKWLLNKVLWAQHEALIGLLILIEHRDDEWAIHWFDKVYRYVIDKFPLQKHGFSLWQIEGNRTLDFEESGYRIENFHHPRYLMTSILTYKRMINKMGG